MQIQRTILTCDTCSDAIEDESQLVQVELTVLKHPYGARQRQPMTADYHANDVCPPYPVIAQLAQKARRAGASITSITA